MEISRFPGGRLLRMPGSTTTRGRLVSRDHDTDHLAFYWTENISAANLSYAAQYLAYRTPLSTHAHGSGPVLARYAFTVTDLHRLPSAGLPAHPSTPSV
jgi:hypothetical protein